MSALLSLATLQRLAELTVNSVLCVSVCVRVTLIFRNVRRVWRTGEVGDLITGP